jgi:L-threonylcarbamoyladenylate synthase
MKIHTQVMPITDKVAITTAQAIIAKGGLIVFPTDTLYGLACDYRNINAIQKIYEAKGRSAAKALPVLIANLPQLTLLSQNFSLLAQRLIEEYWPGPLTLILPKLENLPAILTPYPGLAVRMPAHPFALELLSKTGPLAVTSANLSDHPNPLDAQGVLDQLIGKVDLLLDGGALTASPGSTIVDCTTDHVKLIRQGVIPFEDLLDVSQK